MATAAEFRQRADQCRRLAEAITARDDPAIASLPKLAAEYEAKAIAIEAGENSAPPEKDGTPLSDT
jgi:hypothetical protein